jgi:hypothetical protein
MFLAGLMQPTQSTACRRSATSAKNGHALLHGLCVSADECFDADCGSMRGSGNFGSGCVCSTPTPTKTSTTATTSPTAIAIPTTTITPTAATSATTMEKTKSTQPPPKQMLPNKSKIYLPPTSMAAK